LPDSRRAPAWFLWTLAGAVFLCDWLSKRWVLGAFSEVHTREILGDFVRFSFVRNTGVAFGLFSGGGLRLSWVSLVALVAVLWLAFRPTSRRWPHAVSLGLILGGAVGNLFDRLRYGSVIDFIDVGVGGLRWWVFNLADAAITVGVLLWAAEILLARPRLPAEAPAGAATLAVSDAGVPSPEAGSPAGDVPARDDA
jgi:signal peptidase II